VLAALDERAIELAKLARALLLFAIPLLWKCAASAGT
jgi:hypothetical protein